MFKDILLGDTILSRSEKEKVSQVFERLQRECGVFISRYISKNESPILEWKMEITRVQNMFAKFFGMYKRRAIKISLYPEESKSWGGPSSSIHIHIFDCF